MAGCGLKGSLCRDGTISPVDPLTVRFYFVDGIVGAWTTNVEYENVTCPVGGLIVFHYNAAHHDIVQLRNSSDWENCQNVAEHGKVLSVGTPSDAQRSASTDDNIMTYYYNCSEPGSTSYVTCSVPGHCQAGQKVMIQTSATEYAYNTTTGDWILHVDSLDNVLRLLGGESELDLAFQTEELADQTTELIWCGLDHCPHFVRDVDAAATLEECQTIIYTLMGYVTRKRPIPQWDRAEEYYMQALNTTGVLSGASENENIEENRYWCTAQSYLTELYLTKGDLVNGTASLQTLCSNCQEPNLVQDVKEEYQRLVASGSVLSDFDTVCIFSSIASSRATMFSTDGFVWIILLMCLVRWLR